MKYVPGERLGDMLLKPNLVGRVDLLRAASGALPMNLQIVVLEILFTPKQVGIPPVDWLATHIARRFNLCKWPLTTAYKPIVVLLCLEIQMFWLRLRFLLHSLLEKKECALSDCFILSSSLNTISKD
jgi:hypothetical protein